MNSLDVDDSFVNVNGPSIDRSPMSVNGPYVNGNQTDWTPPHNGFHYQISLLGCLGPSFSAHPLLLTPSLSLVYVTAQVPLLSRQIARALKQPRLSDGFGATLLQGRTTPPLVHDPYLHVFCASILARWIPEKIPPNHFRDDSLNIFQTFS